VGIALADVASLAKAGDDTSMGRPRGIPGPRGGSRSLRLSANNVFDPSSSDPGRLLESFDLARARVGKTKFDCLAVKTSSEEISVAVRLIALRFQAGVGDGEDDAEGGLGVFLDGTDGNAGRRRGSVSEAPSSPKIRRRDDGS
jgi:hypothetical protein